MRIILNDPATQPGDPFEELPINRLSPLPHDPQIDLITLANMPNGQTNFIFVERTEESEIGKFTVPSMPVERVLVTNADSPGGQTFILTSTPRGNIIFSKGFYQKFDPRGWGYGLTPDILIAKGAPKGLLLDPDPATQAAPEGQEGQTQDTDKSSSECASLPADQKYNIKEFQLEYSQNFLNDTNPPRLSEALPLAIILGILSLLTPIPEEAVAIPCLINVAVDKTVFPPTIDTETYIKMYGFDKYDLAQSDASLNDYPIKCFRITGEEVDPQTICVGELKSDSNGN